MSYSSVPGTNRSKTNGEERHGNTPLFLFPGLTFVNGARNNSSAAAAAAVAAAVELALALALALVLVADVDVDAVFVTGVVGVEGGPEEYSRLFLTENNGVKPTDCLLRTSLLPLLDRLLRHSNNENGATAAAAAAADDKDDDAVMNGETTVVVFFFRMNDEQPIRSSTMLPWSLLI